MEKGKKKNKKYLEIYDDVRQDIINGVYKAGTKLPSKRIMADEKGISIITVEHAYELLIEEGYIIPKEKSGYYVSFDKDKQYDAPIIANRIRNHLEIEIDAEAFSYNIYAKTVRRVLTEYGEEVMMKSPGSGTVILREAIANYLARSRHIQVSYDQIIIGSGAEYLYGLIVQSWGRDIVYGIENPSYEKIAQMYEAGGVRLERLDLGQDGIESKALWNSIAGVLHITPYRSYPSRITASAAKKREYLRWSVEKDAIIIEDDFESEFTPSRKPEETLFSLDENDRVIYVNTFTRTIGTSVRTAYMVIPRSMKPILRERIGFYSCPVPTLEQYVLAELIDNGDFERHINKVRRNNRKKK
ncbi:MAG: PLP-dependent aminotransferase family protein [Lachnospiraceae bacterium]|nr:PLP-dependent aminotransferase family protein [Candidatus Colinaster scatohippi]